MINLLSMILLTFSLMSCGDKSSSDSSPAAPEEAETPEERPDPLKYVELKTPSGDVIRTSIAYKPDDQQQGLSGVRSEDFATDEGKLFFYFSEATRTFWMPNTFFALDVFYLDENLEIDRIVRDLPFYQGTSNEDIPRAPAVNSRHVLEMKADSEIANEINVGDSLDWQSSVSLENIEDLMREN